jgi:hypothetical protein
MKMTKLNLLHLTAALGLAAFLAASSAQAQDITWQTPQTITGDANLITPGSGFSEFDALVPDDTSSQIVDGVTFNASSSSSTSVGDVNINLTVNSGTPAFTPGSFARFNNNTPFTGGSTAFNNLLNSGGVFGSDGTITLSNLTLGATYDVQILNYSGDGQAAESTSFLSNTGVTITDNSGQYVTGTFTATGATEQILFSQDVGPFTPVVGAINVEEQNPVTAPEPSTYALLTSGLLALIFLNIRKRRLVS